MKKNVRFEACEIEQKHVKTWQNAPFRVVLNVVQDFVLPLDRAASCRRGRHGGRTKSCTTNTVKYKKASNMGCKGPFDARFAASESSRRALPDYVVENSQKRNCSKMACSVFLPQNTGKMLQNTKKNRNQNKEKRKKTNNYRKMKKK